MPEFENFNVKTTIDCKQGAVRAVRYNGEFLYIIYVFIVKNLPKC